MGVQREYNELKMKSYDIAVRISDLEAALGYDNDAIAKLKKLFSKLQSAINFAIYYKQHKMEKESKLHLDYSFKVIDYIYAAFEKIEVPKAKVEIKLETPKKKRKGFRLQMNAKKLLFIFLAGLVYCFVMYWFFIRGR